MEKTMIDNSNEYYFERDIAKETFTTPEYIVNWIKDFVDNNTKGVMFLQMSRGMGKTTLARALDQLAMNCVSLDSESGSVAIRACYINNMFANKTDRFQNEVYATLCANHRDTAQLFDLPAHNFTNGIRPKNMAGKFAELLSAAQQAYEKSDEQLKKLVFIIDGIDEVRIEDQKKGTIFDCIPASEQLSENVYILLIGRTSDEVNKHISEWYPMLESKAKDAVMRHSAYDENNKSTLVAYLAKQLFQDKHMDISDHSQLSEDDLTIINTIIREGDYRFLHVQMLQELFGDKPSDIISGNYSINQRYLDVLKCRCGDNICFDDISSLLLMISTLNEPATIEELAHLYDSSEPKTMRFAESLNILKGFLYIDRTDANESILMHKSWKPITDDRMHERWRWRPKTDESTYEVFSTVIAEWIHRIESAAYDAGNIDCDDEALKRELSFIVLVNRAAQIYCPQLLYPKLLTSINYEMMLYFINMVDKLLPQKRIAIWTHRIRTWRRARAWKSIERARINNVMVCEKDNQESNDKRNVKAMLSLIIDAIEYQTNAKFQRKLPNGFDDYKCEYEHYIHPYVEREFFSYMRTHGIKHRRVDAFEHPPFSIQWIQGVSEVHLYPSKELDILSYAYYRYGCIAESFRSLTQCLQIETSLILDCGKQSMDRLRQAYFMRSFITRGYAKEDYKLYKKKTKPNHGVVGNDLLSVYNDHRMRGYYFECKGLYSEAIRKYTRAIDTLKKLLRDEKYHCDWRFIYEFISIDDQDEYIKSSIEKFLTETREELISSYKARANCYARNGSPLRYRIEHMKVKWHSAGN